jgi:hypothetical protein
MHDEIVRLLTAFYSAGRVPCADAAPLHITFDPAAHEVRLSGNGDSAYDVVFAEASFVEMVERSGMKPTETLIRVWLGTVYFDAHVYPWARSETVALAPVHRRTSGEAGSA